MIQYMPIDAKLHRSAGWKSTTPGAAPYLYATRETACRLVQSELAQAVAYYPLGFREIPGDSGFDLIAIFSIEPEVNLYMTPEGKWIVPYIPAWYRGYPFRLLPKEGSDQHMLCINMDSGFFTHEPEEADARFFTPEGELTSRFAAIRDFWSIYERDYQNTLLRVQQLNQLGLIVPWEIRLVEGEQSPEKRLEGFFRIDLERLNACKGEDLQALQRSGALALAHAQLLSMPRMNALSELLQVRRKLTQVTPPAADPLNLSGGTLDLSFLRN